MKSSRKFGPRRIGVLALGLQMSVKLPAMEPSHLQDKTQGICTLLYLFHLSQTLMEVQIEEKYPNLLPPTVGISLKDTPGKIKSSLSTS